MLPVKLEIMIPVLIMIAGYVAIVDRVVHINKKNVVVTYLFVSTG